MISSNTATAVPPAPPELAAGFLVTTTIDTFDVAASSIPQSTFSYLANLEWITAKANISLIGPPGTGKSHTLIAVGHAAVAPELKVNAAPPPTWSRRFTAVWRRTPPTKSSTPSSATTCSSSTK